MDQLPGHLAQAEPLIYPTLSPKGQQQLANFLADFRWRGPNYKPGKGRFLLPNVVRDELQEEGVRYALLLVIRGSSLSGSAYGRQVAANRVATVILANPMSSNPMLGSLPFGSHNISGISRHTSTLIMCIVDLESDEILRYQLDAQQLTPVHPFTIRQHLTALFDIPNMKNKASETN